jgi:hypothetical protein
MFYNTKAKANHATPMKMNVVQYSIRIKQGRKYIFIFIWEYHIQNKHRTPARPATTGTDSTGTGNTGIAGNMTLI